MKKKVLKKKIAQKSSKKGVALETIISFIIGIVFLVLVIFVIARTGLLSTVKEQVVVMVCTFSTRARDVLLDVIWSIVSIMITALTIFSALLGFSKGAGVAKSDYSSWTNDVAMSPFLKLQTLKGSLGLGLKTAAPQILAGLGLGGMISLMVVWQIFPGIPLICPTLTINVGTSYQPVFSTTFVNEIASKTIDCYSMYGSGDLDALFGIDPPNPRICFTLETHLKVNDSINMSEVYYRTYEMFNQSWSLGENENLKLHLFCGTTHLGNDPTTWGSCNVQNKRVYVLFLDRHEWDWTGSLESGVCGGFTVGPFGTYNQDVDGIVWCVEDI